MAWRSRPQISGEYDWEKVYRPKKEGWLGVRNLQLWTLAAGGKIALHMLNARIPMDKKGA